MSAFLVLRRENFKPSPSWREAGQVEDAADAADAFRRIVLDHERQAVKPGEYLIVPLDGAWRVGAEIMLRDLSEPV